MADNDSPRRGGEYSSERVASRIQRDMGLTLADFIRSLPAAIAPLGYQQEGRLFTIAHPAGSVTITLGDTAERRIASLSLPVTPVEFVFAGLGPDDRERFMRRFDRYFQRGGG